MDALPGDSEGCGDLFECVAVASECGDIPEPRQSRVPPTLVYICEIRHKWILSEMARSMQAP